MYHYYNVKNKSDDEHEVVKHEAINERMVRVGGWDCVRIIWSAFTGIVVEGRGLLTLHLLGRAQ